MTIYYAIYLITSDVTTMSLGSKIQKEHHWQVTPCIQLLNKTVTLTLLYKGLQTHFDLTTQGLGEWHCPPQTTLGNNPSSQVGGCPKCLSPLGPLC